MNRGTVLAELRAAIQASLPSSGDQVGAVRVNGSWSTGDVHLPTSGNRSVRSFSDVDLVTANPIDASAAEAIRSRILDVASGRGVLLTGVSLRSQQDLSKLPHAATLPDNGYEWPQGATSQRAIVFWANVAALEAAITLRRHETVDRAVASSYIIGKFFFTLVRNAALSSGRVLFGYSELCDWADRRLRHLPLVAALEVKRGDRDSLSQREAEDLLSPSAVGRLASARVEVCSLAADVLRTRVTTLPLPVQRYVSQSAELAYSPATRRVVEREERKYRLAGGDCE